MTTGFEMLLPLSGPSCQSLWNAIVDALDYTGHLEDRYQCQGRRTAEGILRSIDGRLHFRAVGERFEVSAVRHGSGFWLVVVDQIVDAPPIWDCIVNHLCAHNEFILSCIHDNEYIYWQNEEVIGNWELSGRDHSGCALYYDTTFERDRIDTSRNPGRRTFRDGYIEQVSAKMWLGSHYERITGGSIARILSQDWLKTEVWENGTVVLQAWPDVFTSAGGVQGELQNRLRELLYPRREGTDG